jgi:CheY-like chemotaxis protein
MEQLRVLIVEDIQVMRMLYIKYFEKMLRQSAASSRLDLQVMEASNGRAGLEILGRTRGSLDLILLDVMMPEVDGYTFLEEKQKNTEHAGVPVILCSAIGEGGVSEKAAHLNVSAFLCKPFTFDGFVKVIGKFLKLA